MSKKQTNEQKRKDLLIRVITKNNPSLDADELRHQGITWLENVVRENEYETDQYNDEAVSKAKVLSQMQKYIPGFDKAVFEHLSASDLKVIMINMFKKMDLPYPLKVWRKINKHEICGYVSFDEIKNVMNAVFNIKSINDLLVVSTRNTVTNIKPLIEIPFDNHPVKAYIYQYGFSTMSISIISEYDIGDRFEGFGKTVYGGVDEGSVAMPIEEYSFESFHNNSRKFSFRVANEDMYIFFGLMKKYLDEKYPDEVCKNENEDDDEDDCETTNISPFGSWHRADENASEGAIPISQISFDDNAGESENENDK